MANAKWKPLYEYKNSFLQEILCYIGALFLFAVGVGWSIAFGVFGKIFGIIAVCFGIYFLSFLFTCKIARQRMGAYNVESFCWALNGLLLAKTGNRQIGLFTPDGNVVIKPEFRNIIIKDEFYLLEKFSGEWGVYNTKLGKYILDCKYSSVQVEKNGNITGIKDGVRYLYSPYGSLIRQTKENDPTSKIELML